jgi:hypothetical protein
VSQPPSHAIDSLPLPFVILCISVLLASVLNFLALRRRTDSTIEQNPTAKRTLDKTAPAAAPIPVGVESLDSGMPIESGVAMTLPDGRTVTVCRVEALAAAYKSYTKDQFNRKFAGKWVKMSGEINDIHSDGDVWLKASEGILLQLQFGKGWSEPLAALSRAATVTFRGKIWGASIGYITIMECELL